MKIKTTIEVVFDTDLTEESLKSKIKVWLTNKRPYPIKADISSITTEIHEDINIIYWLDRLPEPYRSQAIANVREFSKDNLCDTQAEAVNHGFHWERTSEGHDYWKDVFDKLKGGLPLDKVEDAVLPPRKKRIDYFNEFPPFYKYRLIANTPTSLLEEFVDDAKHSLRSAFIFASSPEGNDFWQQFSDTLSDDYVAPRKTINEWLVLLPEPYRTQSLSNAVLGGTYEATSIKSALHSAFPWTASPEGHKYWEDLRDSL